MEIEVVEVELAILPADANALLDAYNTNMHLYELIQDEKYKMNASIIMHKLKEGEYKDYKDGKRKEAS